MAHDGGGSLHDLVLQTWTMYSIAMVLFLLRLYARCIRLGFRWQIDDFLMVLAVFWYTTLAVTNIAIMEGGGSSLYLPGQFETFTPEDILERIKGSKIEFASENVHAQHDVHAQSLHALHVLPAHHNFVKACSAYTFCGWLATLLVLFLNCHPLSGYWTLPPPQEECASYFRYDVTQCVFNISSDLAMLSIILPVLFRMKMPLKTKAPLLIIFSMGLVVVICACISKYFTFRDIWDDSYQFWYVREASIAMYVTNLPYVWSLARQTFRVLPSDNADTFQTEAKYANGPYFRSKTGAVDTRKRLYGLDTINERAAGAACSESKENIIQMKAVLRTVGPNDYAKYPGW